jgi:hypothetical protein
VHHPLETPYHLVVAEAQLSHLETLILNLQLTFVITCMWKLESPITEHVSINAIPLNKLRDFCVIGRPNQRATNVLWVSEVKEHLRKHRKQMNDSLLQFCWKVTLDPTLVPAPYLPHFQSLFWVIKNPMGVPTRALQNFFIFQKQRFNNPRF